MKPDTRSLAAFIGAALIATPIGFLAAHLMDADPEAGLGFAVSLGIGIRILAGTFWEPKP